MRSSDNYSETWRSLPSFLSPDYPLLRLTTHTVYRGRTRVVQAIESAKSLIWNCRRTSTLQFRWDWMEFWGSTLVWHSRSASRHKESFGRFRSRCNSHTCHIFIRTVTSKLLRSNHLMHVFFFSLLFSPTIVCSIWSHDILRNQKQINGSSKTRQHTL